MLDRRGGVTREEMITYIKILLTQLDTRLLTGY